MPVQLLSVNRKWLNVRDSSVRSSILAAAWAREIHRLRCLVCMSRATWVSPNSRPTFPDFTGHCAGIFRATLKVLQHRFRFEVGKVGDLHTANRRICSVPEVAAHYAALEYLTPCERFLFDRHITPQTAILDVGVGGGRTTPYLSQVASHYVGLDYSEEMVKICRKKFPQLKFSVADASNLAEFQDASFDVVVMSFNTIDYLLPDEKRQQCLEECRRVLRNGGVLIFSSHNPRSILVRPAWDRARLRAFAGKLV